MTLSRISSKSMILLKTGFFHIFGASVLNKVLAFLSTLVLVRVISKADYGVYTYASTIYNMIEIMAGFGAASGALQICAENIGDKLKFSAAYQYAMRFGSAFDLGLSVVCLLIGLFVPLEIPGANFLICLLSLLPVLSLWQNMQTIYLRAKQANTAFATLSLISTIIAAVLTVSGAYLGAATGMVYARYLAAIISLIFAYYYLHVPLLQFSSPQLSQTEKRDILRVSGISMINNGLSALLYLADVFVVGLIMSSETQVAAYKVATQIPTALIFIPSAIVTYIYPYFAQHHLDKNWCLRRFGQLILGLGGLNLIIGATLIIFAPFWVSLIFGAQYLDAVTSFQILCAGYIVSGTFRIIAGNLLVTQRKLTYNTVVAVISGAVNVICDFLFISWWGIEGAALATFLVQMLTGAMNTGYLVYILKAGK
ncbi:MAG: oligosaccharide flippase family protein [Psychrobacter sp.]|nr:oligosaccharide flippase family protein [Psychrobacter sp.]